MNSQDSGQAPGTKCGGACRSFRQLLSGLVFRTIVTYVIYPNDICHQFRVANIYLFLQLA
jgi:hypothetical protein